ncbi:MAG: WYL domain-containing protein [Deltaproteobacteria bacterium]|nr:WYL domain-containing protein [Deltaproteobacteria bacterium]
MAWSIERRLAFIDFRLYWEGRINRKDLTDFFGISVPQASADLSNYQEKAPKNIGYDKSAKFYFATEDFKPVFISSDSSNYLSQLRLISNGVLKEDEAFLGLMPSFDTIPNPERSVDAEVLRSILKAINNDMSLEIEYQSMSRPEPIWRRIVPHSLSYDGYRWNIRAYCHLRKDFIDFLLARIIRVKDPKPDETDAATDILWHNFIDVKIAPHPEFEESQKKIIERDYGMKNGVGSIRVRAALWFYLEKRLGLSEGRESRPPNEQQIVLVNRDEIKRALDTYRTLEA